MAQNPTRAHKKRLASAKPRQADAKGTVKGDKAKGQSLDPLRQAEIRSARRKKLTAIGVGIFAVLMALSMMLPSLSTIFMRNEANTSTQSDSSDTSSQTSDSTESSDSSTNSSDTGVSAVDTKYQALVDTLTQKLSANANDLATLLNLGNNYMNWAYAASAYATDDSGTSHVNELYAQAIDYYNKYLALNDSDAVKVNIALCTFYSGDSSGATDQLLKLTESSPNYGPAWANLGLTYEAQGDSDKARAAYAKAEEMDPQDEYGAKSYAEQRIAAMDAAASSSSSSSSATATGTGSNPTSGLSEDLATKSGTTL